MATKVGISRKKQGAKFVLGMPIFFLKKISPAVAGLMLFCPLSSSNKKYLKKVNVNPALCLFKSVCCSSWVYLDWHQANIIFMVFMLFPSSIRRMYVPRSKCPKST